MARTLRSETQIRLQSIGQGGSCQNSRGSLLELERAQEVSKASVQAGCLLDWSLFGLESGLGNSMRKSEHSTCTPTTVFEFSSYQD